MGEDWKPGDLALRVAKPGRVKQLTPGRIFTVEAVIHGVRYRSGRAGTGLVLRGVTQRNPSGSSWSGNYRKLDPHTEDEQDRETIRLLTQVPETVDA